MKKKLVAIVVALVMILSLVACGAGEETTVTGMVVAVDGTVISLVQMDADEMGSMDFAQGERPQMQGGMEGFQGFEGFDPESMEGFDPESFEGFDPENFEGSIPEGENFPQRGDGEMPGGMTPPEGMELPEGMTMPENGQMPGFDGEDGAMGFNFGNFSEDMETKDIDIADAHISVEIDGGKASGSMEDIRAGTFVTVTLNRKGEATYVLVSSQSFFGGRNMGQAG